MKKNKLFTFGLMLLCSIGLSSAADQTVSAGSDASTIQAAIDAASGSTVRIAVGRYFLDVELTIPSGVTVIGGFKGGFTDDKRIYPGAAVTIDDMTVLDGNSLFYTKPVDKHRVATVEGTLDGVLVRNGHVRNGNGGGLYVKSTGIVQNCIIKGNVAMQVPDSGDDFDPDAPALGGGVYIENVGGKLINSVVAYNMSNQGYGVAGIGGDVVNCTVTANTYAPVPVQVKAGTFRHFKHWRTDDGTKLPWGTGSDVYPYSDGPSEHETPDMGISGDGTGMTSEFDPGEITLSAFYLAQTEVTTSQYAVFANAIDLTFDSGSRNVSFGVDYLKNASSNAITGMTGLIDPSPIVLRGATAVNAAADFPAGGTVGTRYGFSTDGILFNVNNGSLYGLRKVGSDFIYYPSATSGQINLRVSNESMGLVSWYGSLAFSLWLGGTLPTEAQWEFAARRRAADLGSGDDPDVIDKYCNVKQFAGSDDLNSVGWYKDNNTPADNVHEVGAKAANEIGLYDMTGNQWEWVADWINNTSYSTNSSLIHVYYPNYATGYSVATGTVSDLTKVTSGNTSTDPIWNFANAGSYRVFRGGSWSYAVGYLSLTCRNNNTPANVSTNLSFRPALVP
jgi:formylglycine-generating enzyme required for sulfatase activity